MNRTSERETVVELPWAADSCPWVWKLRTVLQLTAAGGDQWIRKQRQLRAPSPDQTVSRGVKMSS
jgi:hypothetical protein